MASRIYLGRISYRAQERDIEKFFKGFGKIRDIMLKNGYAFVEFEDYRDADDAVGELNGRSLCGERVIVEHARGTPHGEDLRRDRERGYEQPPPPRSNRNAREKYGPPTRTENRVVIENLSSKVSWQDLKDFMRQAGEVTYADAHREHKNEGVVEFATNKEMRRAIDKLDGLELCGRRIKLVEDKSRGRKRSISRSNSRSSSRHKRKSGIKGSHSKNRDKISRSHSSKSGSLSKSPDRKKPRDDKRKSRSRSKSPDRKNDLMKNRRADERSGSDDESQSRSPDKKRNGSSSDHDRQINKEDSDAENDD